MQPSCSPSYQWLENDSNEGMAALQSTRQHPRAVASVAGSPASNDSLRHQQFFKKYHVKEVMRGYELVQDGNLFAMARKYGSHDLRLLATFLEDGALEFFEHLKHFRGSDILELRESAVDLRHQSHAYRLSSGSRDSGYYSRPSSQIGGSIGANATAFNSSLPINQRHTTIVEQECTGTLPFQSSFELHNRLAPTHGSFSSNSWLSRSPYDSSNDSIVPSPVDTSKPTKARPYECIYCPQDFVHYGHCLNHEENNHSQRKEWICPHCRIQSKTKAGHERHHKNHGCQQCTEPEQVVILSGPKTACACPYCGSLFEGIDCFAIRANHVKMTHYKGEQRKTRIHMDHSSMIHSLLSRDSLSSLWRSFMGDKPRAKLSWSNEVARELLDDLEFAEFPRGVLNHMQHIYDSADKSELSSKIIEEDIVGQSEMQIMVQSTIKAAENDLLDIGNRSKSTNGKDEMDFAMEDSSQWSSQSRAITTAQRTRELLSAFEPDPTVTPENIGGSRWTKSAYEEPSQLSESLRDDVFMGCENNGQDTLSESAKVVSLTPSPRHPTPPSRSWAFVETDDPLMRMRDLLSQQILASVQPVETDRSYIPPSWDDSLPPSLRIASANNPPNASLRTTSQRRQSNEFLSY